MTDSRSHGDRDLVSLIKELRDESLLLMRQEIALARTEIGDKVSRTGRNVAAIAAGALVAFAGLVVFVLMLGNVLAVGFTALGIDIAISAWLGPLTVGVIVMLIGYALVKKGTTTLKNTKLVPEQTVQSIKENARWATHKTA